MKFCSTLAGIVSAGFLSFSVLASAQQVDVQAAAPQALELPIPSFSVRYEWVVAGVAPEILARLTPLVHLSFATSMRFISVMTLREAESVRVFFVACDGPVEITPGDRLLSLPCNLLGKSEGYESNELTETLRRKLAETVRAGQEAEKQAHRASNIRFGEALIGGALLGATSGGVISRLRGASLFSPLALIAGGAIGGAIGGNLTSNGSRNSASSIVSGDPATAGSVELQHSVTVDESSRFAIESLARMASGLSPDVQPSPTILNLNVSALYGLEAFFSQL